MERVDLRQPRRTRGFLLLCVASPLVLCLGWIALWLYARQEATRAMDGWIASEAVHGREWTCPDRRIAGFPLQLRLTCAAPTYRDISGGDIEAASLAGIEASTYVYQPRAIMVAFVSPATIRKTADQVPVNLAWTSFTIEARLLPDDRLRFAMLIDGSSLERQGVTSQATHVEIRVGPATGAPAQDHAYEVWSKIDEGRVPVIDTLSGTPDPLSLDEKGVLTALDPQRIDRWPVMVDAWRQAGGAFTLTSLAIRKGDFHGEAQGLLGLDDAHRLSGRLQTEVWGYEALAARFGISPRALSMGSMLSNLLTRGAPPDPSATASIKLPVSFKDGRIAIGPVVTAQRLVPFY